MKLSDDLRQSVLQAAMEGKLTKQLKEDGNADDLLGLIEKEKAKLIKEQKIKKTKPLPKISEDEIPFDIPDNWRWVRLSSVISLLSGADLLKSQYNSSKKGIPYITGASNIIGSKVLINRWTLTPKNIANKGDLLLTCKGTVGKIAVLNEEKVHIARQIMALTPIIINKYFLKYYLELNVDSLKKSAKSMIPGIDRNTVLSSLFPLPPLAEQHRIVKKVDMLMAEIDELEKKENELEKLKKEFPEDMKESLLQAALSGKLTKQSKNKKVAFVSKKQKEEPDFEIPESWAFANISEVSKNIPSKKYQINTSEIKKEGRYPVISQSKDFISGYSNLSDKLLHVEEPIVMFGDHTTEVKYIDFDFIVGADGTKLFQCKKDLILSKYFAYVLTYYSLGLQRKGGYSRHYKFIKNKAVPLPPLAEQHRIVEKLDELLPLCEELKENEGHG